MIAYITVPEPCHENWQAMTPNEQGRHCAQCCKTVIDFSDWEPQEIIYYLKAHQSDHVCGRFRNEQLHTPVLSPENFVWQVSQTPLSTIKKIAAIFLFVFGLMSASCNSNTQPPQQPAPKPVQQQVAAPDSEYNGVLGGVGLSAPPPYDTTAASVTLRPPRIITKPVPVAEVDPGELYEPGHTGGLPVVEEIPQPVAVQPDTSAPMIMGKIAAPAQIDTTKNK